MSSAVQVGAELAGCPCPLHGRNDLASDYQGANIAAVGLLDVLLHENRDLRSVKGLDHGLGRFMGFAKHHSDALGAFKKLDDDRRAANQVDDFIGASGIVGESSHRQPDAVAREDLQGAQFVA